MTGRVLIEARDAYGNSKGLLRGWDRLEAVSRYCDIGAGQVTCPATSHNRKLLAEPNTVIAVRDESRILHFGPVVKVSDGATADANLQVQWKDGIEWMRRRLCLPEPSVQIVNGQPLPTGSDDRSAATSTVIMGYVDANLGPAALRARRLPGLSIGRDLGVGVILTAPVQARFDNLLDLSRPLAVTGGVQFTMDAGDRSYTFNVRQVENLGNEVVFSAQTHGLESGEYSVSAPTSTVIYVGGKGEGADRVFAEVQTPDSEADEAAFGRFETFKDDRSAEGDALTTAAERDLAEKGSTITAEFVPSNLSLVYGTHYQLGDLVTCVMRPGLSVVKPIRQVTFSASAGSGLRVRPIAGDYAATSATGAQFTTKQVVKAVSALERNR